ncbi:acyl-CoA dehydrogenase family protein, partial [Nocardia gipuzkoensis]
ERKVRRDVAGGRLGVPTVWNNLAGRAGQVHAPLGVTNELPLFRMVHGAAVLGLADGPTEVHKTTVAKQVLREHHPADDVWPTEWIPRRRESALAKYAEFLEHEVGNR